MSLTKLYLSKGLAFLQTLVIKAAPHIHFSATAPGNQSQQATDALIAAVWKIMFTLLLSEIHYGGGDMALSPYS